MPTTPPYTVADSKTDAVLVNFKWRVVAPTDVAAAPTSDFPGGVYPSGTGSIAANAQQRQAQFTIDYVANTTVTGDRSYDVEIYDVTPVGTTLTVSKVRTKIAEDDVAAPANLYGPQTVSDTGSQTVGSTNKYRIYGTLGDTPWKLYINATDADGDPGHVLERANAGNFRLTPIDSVTAQPADNNWLYVANGAIGPNTPFEIIHDRAANTLSVKIGDMTPVVRAISNIIRGSFWRFITGNATTATITAAAVS